MNCRATDHIVIQNMYKMSSPSPDRGPDCDEEIKVDLQNPVMSSEEGFYSNDDGHRHGIHAPNSEH